MKLLSLKILWPTDNHWDDEAFYVGSNADSDWGWLFIIGGILFLWWLVKDSGL